MRRRALLALIGSGLGGAAGCLDLADDAPLPAIASMSIRNRAGELVDVTLSIFEDDDPVFEAALAVEPGEEPIEADPVDGPGAYSLVASLDGNEQTVEAMDHVEGDERCLEVRFELGGSTGFHPPSVIAHEDC